MLRSLFFGDFGDFGDSDHFYQKDSFEALSAFLIVKATTNPDPISRPINSSLLPAG
jgi:hypothetical protein